MGLSTATNVATNVMQGEDADSDLGPLPSPADSSAHVAAPPRVFARSQSGSWWERKASPAHRPPPLSTLEGLDEAGAAGAASQIELSSAVELSNRVVVVPGPPLLSGTPHVVPLSSPFLRNLGVITRTLRQKVWLLVDDPGEPPWHACSDSCSTAA